KTANLIVSFVESYEANKHSQSLEEWLKSEFRKYPVWRDDEELQSTAYAIIETIKQRNNAKNSLEMHLAQGKSEASWLAKHIDQGAKAAGVTDVGRYASTIENAVKKANEDIANLILTKDGVTSQAYNLDGFLAEQHHVDSFNLDAAAKNSNLRAKVLTPNGGVYGKNSMDVGVYHTDMNGNIIGKPLKRYQLKYGQNSQATQTLLNKGDYRGQQKLVPAEQINQVNGSTDRLSCEGVESKPLTKAEAKTMQEKAQKDAESRQYEWNDVSRIEISKTIGKQAMLAACLTAAFHGARIAGRRVWNWVLGKGNPPFSEDLNEFFTSSVKGSLHTGAQVAVSGAVVIAAKSGWLGALAKGAKAMTLTSAAYAGLENAKIMWQFGTGKLTAIEAMDAMGRLNTSMIGGIVLATEAAAIGATFGLVFGPIGSLVGGVVGAVAGGIAGSAIASKIHEGWNMIIKTASEVITKVSKSAWNGAKAIFSGLASLFS
ncbi:MAG: hypothetical protein PF483_16130, partial [Halothiobacillus sp.]|nr:hypothetical protein [Halothiobacillus sp.]